jgi:nucleotide-binding universal stress UspA family protein
MKIMMAVDNSVHARAAIELVKSMPWGPRTQVLVVSIAAIPVQTYSEVYVGVGAVPVEAWETEQHACEQLVDSAATALKGSGLQVRTRVLKGDPREALVDLARSEQVDLLVVGSHGRTGLSKLLMGSVASHVVTHAPCNVLVVKQHRDS